MLILVFGWQRAHMSIVKTVVTFGMDIACVMPARTRMAASDVANFLACRRRLEPLCGYDRRVDLDEATASLIALEAALGRPGQVRYASRRCRMEWISTVCLSSLMR